VSRWTRALYDFSGVHAFKAKLCPDAWEPIYLSYPKGSGPNRALYDSLAAFARGSFARFGVQTLLRGPAIVVRLLAVLLIPWTILLMLAGATQFFPSALVKWSWVGFDVLLAIALFALASRWRRWLGLALAAAVTADSILTLFEVLAYNVPRAHDVIDTIVLLVAWLAPTFAAVTLWGAVSRSERASPAVV
jgi:phosphatidylglycerol lysyltransferase